MTVGPTSDSYLGEALHNNPKAYWCPHCWMFTLDCSHLVATLDAPFVNMSDWLIKRLAYDRTRRILELENEHTRAIPALRRVTSTCSDACEIRIPFRIS